jgi:DNA mismatch repair protein MutH
LVNKWVGGVKDMMMGCTCKSDEKQRVKKLGVEILSEETAWEIKKGK